MATTPPADRLAAWGTPPAEVDIQPATVRALLCEQAAQWADLPLTRAAEGWDNVMFRLGDALAVRLPRRAVAAALIEHEQRWLPQLHTRLPLAIPTPVLAGRPGAGYPWPWSVVPWLAGDVALDAPLGSGEGVRLAAFLRHLHTRAPDDAPPNPVRGVPLAQRAAALTARLERVRTRTDLITPALLELWTSALAAPATGQRTWLHGDLHPGNVLVRNQRLAAVIDWGDITAGDPATDLSAVWMLLERAGERARARNAYAPADDPVWMRARGWAFMLGVVHLDSGLRNSPSHARIGARTLQRLQADLERQTA